jgi:DNA-binding transcriptional ArsR family regulator
MKLFFRRFFSLAAAIVLLLGATSCRQRVMLNPGEDDLVVLNGCVVSACNYLAVVKTQHTLDKNFWAKILLVRFENHPAGHAYCVWETEGNVYGYDRNSGAFPIPVYTRDPRAIAIVLAQELSRILNEPLAVSEAEFATLRDRLEVSDSVLSKHLSSLSEAGYVRLRKGAHHGRRTTWVALTGPGRRAVGDHVAALRALIADVP